MNEGRRVRSVRLRATSRALVQRGAVLLEDALRTASMPDPGRGRVLFIRSLALGVIRPNLSSSSLALALERKVQALARDAVHAEEEGAPAADAVYFPDAVRALVALAVRLGERKPLRGWFWPLVVPEAWGKPLDEALRAVLAAAIETEPGPAAAVSLVDELMVRGAAGPMLGALRWTDGPALARAFWGYAPEVERGVLLAGAPSVDLEVMPPRARALVEAWVEAWGPEDLRSLWLGAVALSLGRPARVVEVELPARSMRLVAAVAAEARARRVEAPAGERRPAAPRAAGEVREEVGAPGRKPVEAEPVPVVRRARGRAEEGPTGRGVPEAVEGEAGAVPSRRAEAPAERVAELAGQAEVEVAAEVFEWPEVPEPTRAGGLLFLVHVLEYLGFPEFLAAHPELRERAVAEHFLARVAARFKVSPGDPVLRALRAHELPPLAGRCAFSLPETFRERAGVGALVRRLQEERELELDASGRMVLAIRYPDNGADSQDAAAPDADSLSRSAHDTDTRGTGAHGVGPSAATRTPSPSDLELLLRSLHLAASRVLRTRAQISLRALVLRPGRVSATRTHLDVLFDHEQADLRVRRAGLDVDPGWVPWLGRVIRYHYLHGELPQA